jgi:hypothetical protein
VKTPKVVLLFIFLVPLLGAEYAPEIWVSTDLTCDTEVGAPAGTICSDKPATGQPKGVWVCPEPGPCGEVTPWLRTNRDTHTSCTHINAAELSPNTTYPSRWRSALAGAITEIWCETDVGSLEMDLAIDDGSPQTINGSYIICASEPGTVDDDFANPATMEAGNTLDVQVARVATATTLNVCWRHRDN